MINTTVVNKLMHHPEEVIEHLDLVYVADDQMPIIRLKHKEHFTYLLHNKPLKDSSETLKRIEALGIPPAWQNVKITHLPNGHLQAVGRDTKQRKQYRYHPLWIKARKQTKFYRMASFGKALPSIRKQVDKDLEQTKWCQTKVLALVIRLMEETHIRIGNEQYAQRNQTYGLSTLRKRHIDISKERLKFNFKGKRGKAHSITLRNKRLIRLVSQCEDIPGWELFHYYDSEGTKQNIDSGMVNTYIKNISGKHFTAKDFRTWAAGVVFFNALMDRKPANTKKAIKKTLLEAYDATAKALGNTRNVCRKSYVHPLLPLAYEKGELTPYFKEAQQPGVSQNYFSPSEKSVLDLISNYTPEF